MPPEVIVITGPTATGKTALGVLIAQKLDGEVVSADSMQLYRYMDIGTAKPTNGEMAGVKHHMIDIADPRESYSAARFVEEAGRCVDDILSRGKRPIIVGGTGLYIDSLLAGRSFAQREETGHLRQQLSDLYDEMGGEAMLKRLSLTDPERGAKLHPNDKKRIVRALEAAEGGSPLSEHDRQTQKAPPRYSAIKIALSFRERQDLYDRINARVDEMLRRGLEKEVRGLLEMGLSFSHTAMQAIGYKEMAEAILSGGDMGQASELIKLRSRRYAKRQLSWLRRDDAVRWILWDKTINPEEGLRLSTSFFEKDGII